MAYDDMAMEEKATAMPRVRDETAQLEQAVERLEMMHERLAKRLDYLVIHVPRDEVPSSLTAVQGPGSEHAGALLKVRIRMSEVTDRMAGLLESLEV